MKQLNQSLSRPVVFCFLFTDERAGQDPAIQSIYTPSEHDKPVVRIRRIQPEEDTTI
jgi:hypothetical protein